MKKVYIIVSVVLLNFMFYSCTPQALDNSESILATECCGEEGTIPPPPPPPPPGEGNEG